MSELFVVGTGSSINTVIPALRLLKDKPVLAWGRGIEFCIEKLKFAPPYWSYIDPGSAINGLDYIRKQKLLTQVCLFDPFLMRNLETLRTYIGRPSHPYNLDTHYNHYIQRVQDLRQTNITPIPTTSMKYLSTKYLHSKRIKGGRRKKDAEAFQLRNHSLQDQDAEYRFNYKKLILGSSSVDKLTMCVLPLCSFLHKNSYLWTDPGEMLDVYLLGFDGKGHRFFNTETMQTPTGAARLRKHFKRMESDRECWIPKWLEWAEFSKINPISLIPKPFSTLHRHLPNAGLYETLAYKNDI